MPIQILFFYSSSITALSNTVQHTNKKIKCVSLDSLDCNIPTITLKENKTLAHYTWFPFQVGFPDCCMYKFQQHRLPFMHFGEEEKDPKAGATLIAQWFVCLLF